MISEFLTSFDMVPLILFYKLNLIQMKLHAAALG